ncbi:hypothetical protein [Pseudoclavibacter sp. AY1F1]|uniref:hypothetical protein n=1 Tax=Pseudoclavibacter sp. AY1F1 TaxID=2080583 RepID=UPI0015E3AE63|nr:hypothetical protein [Pseudoclavibacter sp. AY1F1]
MEKPTATTNVEGARAPQLSFGAERAAERDDFSSLPRHPLYFAISRPIGTHTSSIVNALKLDLEKIGYAVRQIKLSNLIERAYRDVTGNSLPSTSSAEGERVFSSYRGLMRAGDTLRLLDPAIVGKLAVLEINQKREQFTQEAVLGGKKGVAYIITHLMHPAEVRTLRSVYGSRFFLIAANARRADRLDYLVEGYRQELSKSPRSKVSTDIGHSDTDEDVESSVNPTALARDLIAIDAGIKSSMLYLDPKTRLNVDDTFQLADLFVRSRAETRQYPARERDKEIDRVATAQITRLVMQLFSYPFGAPTTEESAMSTAFLAAQSSVSLGRSVGAALVDSHGSVVSIGWNEVAKPNGGPYRENDGLDHRDHINGFDPSDVGRIDAIRSFLDVLLTPKKWRHTLGAIEENYPEAVEWLTSLQSYLPEEGVAPVKEAVAGLAGVESFNNTRIMHLIEFGRSVHAEMATLSDAFRRGVGVVGGSMYVTTFPCHECARNLVSFGIDNVFYVEPYGKSMAESLYSQEISVFPSNDASINSHMVNFVPFAGIASRRLADLFSPVARKRGLNDRMGAAKIGSAIEWDELSAPIRATFVDYPPGYDHQIVIPELEVERLGVEVIVAAGVHIQLARAVNSGSDPGKSSIN